MSRQVGVVQKNSQTFWTLRIPFSVFRVRDAVNLEIPMMIGGVVAVLTFLSFGTTNGSTPHSFPLLRCDGGGGFHLPVLSRSPMKLSLMNFECNIQFKCFMAISTSEEGNSSWYHSISWRRLQNNKTGNNVYETETGWPRSWLFTSSKRFFWISGCLLLPDGCGTFGLLSSPFVNGLDMDWHAKVSACPERHYRATSNSFD